MNDLRFIAFYLPQFHPISENDEWWGKGFTEWTNVSSAKPVFPGHYQPHTPADLGFYDLRLPEVREAQARLAKAYGIYGFCYYYYYFNGKRLLNRPLDEVLASGKPDFPFCICWANENWTRRWDGKDDDILIEQVHIKDEDKTFIHQLLPVLKDKRYIRVNNKLLMLVYRVELLPDPNKTAATWRKIVRKEMGEELYLCAVNNFVKDIDPNLIGFDGIVQFPLDFTDDSYIDKDLFAAIHGVDNNDIRDNWFFNYPSAVNHLVNVEKPNYNFFRGVFPGWDNTPRRQKASTIFVNSTPELYKLYLKTIIGLTVAEHLGDERLVFINAWNEWAEGAHLEPDKKYGLRFLESTREALNENNDLKLLLEDIKERDSESKMFYASAGHLNEKIIETGEKIKELNKTIDAQRAGFDEEKAVLSQKTEEKDQQILQLGELLERKELLSGEKETRIQEKEEQIQNKETHYGHLIEQKDLLINEKEKQLQNKEAQLQDRVILMEEKERQLDEQANRLISLEIQIRELEQQALQNDRKANETVTRLKELSSQSDLKSHIIQTLENSLSEKAQLIQVKDHLIAKQESEIAGKEHITLEQSKMISYQSTVLLEKINEIQRFENVNRSYINSFSWKITKPLRWIHRRISKLPYAFIERNVPNLKAKFRGLRANNLKKSGHGRYEKIPNASLILRSGLFDAKYYLRRYPDVKMAKVDPFWHYMLFGWSEGRNPGPQFHNNRYLNIYQDVKIAGINPLEHYVIHGIKEGRKAFPFLEEPPYFHPFTCIVVWLCLLPAADVFYGGLFQSIHSLFKCVQLNGLRLGVKNYFNLVLKSDKAIFYKISNSNRLKRWIVGIPLTFVVQVRKKGSLHTALSKAVILFRRKGLSGVVIGNQPEEENYHGTLDTDSGDETVSTDILPAKYFRKADCLKLLFVSHDSGNTEATILLLNIVRWLRQHAAIDMHMILLNEGPLLHNFKECCPVLLCSETNPGLKELNTFCGTPDLIYGNTKDSARLYGTLSEMGIPIITHIHESEGDMTLVKNEETLQKMKSFTHLYITASESVRNKFLEDHGIEDSRSLLLKSDATDIMMPRLLDAMRNIVSRPYPVSVIVPNYNYAPFLDQRLQSVFNQSFRDFEVIILDDASTDNSIEVLSNWKDQPGTRLVRNKKNSGNVFKQWIKGLKEAKGDLIWIAEADDYCDEDFLLHAIRMLKDENVGLYYCQSVIIDGNNENRGDYLFHTNDISEERWKKDYNRNGIDEIEDTLFLRNTIPNASAVVLRRKYLQGFENVVDEFKMAGDWMTYVYVLQNSKIAFCHLPLNFHRRHSESVFGLADSNTEKATQVAKEIMSVQKFIIQHFYITKSIFDKGIERGFYDFEKLTNISPWTIPILVKKRKEIEDYESTKVLPDVNKSIMIVLSDTEYGGGQLIAIRLASFLAKNNKVYLYTIRPELRDDGVENQISSRVVFLRNKDMDVHLQALDNTIAGIKEYINEFNIKYISSHDWLSDKTVFYAVLDTNVAWLLTMHGYYEDLIERPGKIDVDFDIIGRNVLQRADKIIYTADKNLKVFKELKIDTSDHLIKILNGYVPQRQYPIARKSLNISEDAFIFTLVGRSIPEKGWNQAIQAVIKARSMNPEDIHLFLIGAGAHLDQLKNAYSHLPFIHFLGFISNLADWIATSDAALFPTYFISESQPLTLIEFMAQGKPIIATDIGEIRNMITEGSKEAGILLHLKNGTVDIDEIAESIIKLVSDDNLYKIMARNSMELFGKYSMNLCAGNYLKVMNEF